MGRGGACALSVAARDGSVAAVRGAPIFVGLAVSADELSFEGQTVKRDHELHDADVVELHV